MVASRAVFKEGIQKTYPACGARYPWAGARSHQGRRKRPEARMYTSSKSVVERKPFRSQSRKLRRLSLAINAFTISTRRR